MKLFLTVALSLTLIALVAHAQGIAPSYPPPSAPPPGYAAPPPPPDMAPPEAMPQTPPPGTEMMPPPAAPPASSEMVPPPPPAPQQTVTPGMRPPYPAQTQSAPPPALQAQQQGNITFVSGGAGDEDRDALKQVESQYNLRLLFAARNGDFLANIGVTLADARGRTLLDTVSDGPIFYAHVPPGRYRVTVSNQGQAQTRDVNMGASGAASLDFYWNAAS
ncbi:MAG TPA: hypothetical protein VKV32_10355 [Stellaceae bacterium]|nr:hypothetical protein [Stellaceae bacterium]